MRWGRWKTLRPKSAVRRRLTRLQMTRLQIRSISI